MPLSALPTPSVPTHFLFNSKTDSLPTLDDLVQLESELRALRDEAVTRRDKAEAGLHTMEIIWRRAKDKTRGLARDRETRNKDTDKIRSIKLKRETGEYYLNVLLAKRIDPFRMEQALPHLTWKTLIASLVTILVAMVLHPKG